MTSSDQDKKSGPAAQPLRAQVACEGILGALQQQLALADQPLFLEAPFRPVPGKRTPRDGTQITLATRKLLLQGDWLYHALQPLAERLRLPTERWEALEGRLLRHVKHFLRATNVPGAAPALAALTVNFNRYPWALRAQAYRPHERASFRGPDRDDRGRPQFSFSENLGVLLEHLPLAVPKGASRAACSHRFAALHRQLQVFGKDGAVEERVAYTDQCANAVPHHRALKRAEGRQRAIAEAVPALADYRAPDGLQLTSLVSAIRFLPTNKMFEVLRLSVTHCGSFVYERHTRAACWYLALTEPYNLILALERFRDRSCRWPH